PRPAHPPRLGSRRWGLAVADAPRLGATLRILLSDRWEVTIAPSASSARRTLRERTFDAILCDVALRDESGIDLYRELRASDPQAAATMVFMTGGSVDETIQRFLRSVRDRCIEKPFGPDALHALLERHRRRA
ncbi:MAG: response regulator, partial [Myxococcota bacterium]|nr:response regulator [Myxococcota bacterium]MDW8363498.1 response regulator [Myxococcales bacterium]